MAMPWRRTPRFTGVYDGANFHTHMLRIRIALALAAATVITACGDRSRQAAADSDLANDLALANQAPAVPLLRDTAVSAAPPEQAPRAQPQPQRVARPATVARRSTPTVVETHAPAPTPAPVSATVATTPATRG